MSKTLAETVLCNLKPKAFYRAHTATQIQQVGADAYTHILNARVKNATLQAQIEAATTKEQLELIVW